MHKRPSYNEVSQLKNATNEGQTVVPHSQLTWSNITSKLRRKLLLGISSQSIEFAALLSCFFGLEVKSLVGSEHASDVG